MSDETTYVRKQPDQHGKSTDVIAEPITTPDEQGKTSQLRSDTNEIQALPTDPKKLNTHKETTHRPNVEPTPQINSAFTAESPEMII